MNSWAGAVPALTKRTNMQELDLVDEMAWEDSDKVEWLTLEEAGLEQVERDGVCSAQLAYYMEEGDH